MLLRREIVFLVMFVVIFVAMGIFYAQVAFAQGIVSGLSNTVQSKVSSVDFSSFSQTMINMVKSAFWTAVRIVINAFNNYVVPFFKKYPMLILPVSVFLLRGLFPRR